jgi:uracil phosphoribosyltransferase
MNQVDWKAYFKPDETCAEIRNKYAKLNELNEYQSEAATAAIREAFEAGFATAFVSGLTEGQKVSAERLVKLLAVRTVFSVICALPVVSALLSMTKNIQIAFVGAAVLLTTWFYLWDKFFYSLPKIIERLSNFIEKRKAATQKKKDELPR